MGVAVKAKKLMFGWLARSSIVASSTSSTLTSAPSSCCSAVKTLLSAPAAEPVCEEWASSAITAKRRVFRLPWLRIVSRAKGKVCKVTMMIGVRSISALASCSDFTPALDSILATTPVLCSNW